MQYTLPSLQRSYYLKDHLGSTRVVLSATGTAKESHDYYPFGLKMPGRSAILSAGDTRNLFTGKEHDTETGWDYFGARYYHSGLGRWLVVDPILNKETTAFLMANVLLSVSPYNYTFNRPTVLTDPDGECPQCVSAGIGAALGTFIGGGLEFLKQANGGSLTDISNFSLDRDFDVVKIAGAAAEGAITGAVAGATGGATLVQSISANAVAGGIGGAVKRRISGEQVGDLSKIATDVVAGGAGGAAANLVGKKVANETAGRVTANSLASKAVQAGAKKLPSVARSVTKTVVKKVSDKIQEVIEPEPSKEEENR